MPLDDDDDGDNHDDHDDDDDDDDDHYIRTVSRDNDLDLKGVTYQA